MTFRQKLDAAIAEALLTARQLLGLDPDAEEVLVVYGVVASNDKELAILSRSILEILVYLSSFISVPQVDVLERP